MKRSCMIIKINSLSLHAVKFIISLAGGKIFFSFSLAAVLQVAIDIAFRILAQV